jgi:hypothetical protein
VAQAEQLEQAERVARAAPRGPGVLVQEARRERAVPVVEEAKRERAAPAVEEARQERAAVRMATQAHAPRSRRMTATRAQDPRRATTVGATYACAQT